MNKIHNFIGEQIIKYIFRHGGMITVQRKAGAVQVAKVYSKAAYENVIAPALNLYTHQNIKTQADRIRSFSDEELAVSRVDRIDFYTKSDIPEYIGDFAGIANSIEEAIALEIKWLQQEVEE